MLEAALTAVRRTGAGRSQRGNIRGASGDTQLVGVSCTGFDVSGLDVELSAGDTVAPIAAEITALTCSRR
jgi:hypothetical protein